MAVSQRNFSLFGNLFNKKSPEEPKPEKKVETKEEAKHVETKEPVKYHQERQKKKAAEVEEAGDGKVQH